MLSTASSVTLTGSPPSPRASSASARRRMVTVSCSESGLRTKTWDRREQRRVDLERRILGGGADEDDVARLDPREERVLLGLVEAVNLVDKQNRAAPAGAPGPLGLGHHLADFLDAREHCRKRDEVRARRLGDESRETRLPRARRAPENHRLQQVALDGLPQRLAGRQQILLADVLVEGARAHALGKRRAAPVGCGGRIVEQVGVRHDRPPPWRWR